MSPLLRRRGRGANVCGCRARLRAICMRVASGWADVFGVQTDGSRRPWRFRLSAWMPVSKEKVAVYVENSNRIRTVANAIRHRACEISYAGCNSWRAEMTSWAHSFERSAGDTGNRAVKAADDASAVFWVAGESVGQS